MTEVVPYIGTWIETPLLVPPKIDWTVVPYIGTWIETWYQLKVINNHAGRTLYRYVD